MKFSFKKLSLFLTLLSITISSTSSTQAAGSNLSNCLLPASKNQHVSLGYPVAPERLGQSSSIRIGVLPFYFTDSAEKQLTEAEKNDYLNAAASIGKMSNGLVSISIVFLPTFKYNKPAGSLKQAFSERDVAWSSQDITKGTWGFLRDVIAAADPSRDYSHLDGLVLESNNPDRSFGIAEAMNFYMDTATNVYRNAKSEFFKTIRTQDGNLNNAVLLDVHQGVGTIAHELLHNFGLTDLYGSGTGPGALSIMAAGAQSLLNYEKAVLGWFPTNAFSCKNLDDFLNTNSVENIIDISNIKTDSILLLKKSEDTAYLIEIINSDNKSQLVVYLLEQELRPPISVFYDSKVSYPSYFDLRDPKIIGSKYRTADFEVLVTNKINDSVSLNFIPTKLANSAEAKSLLEKSNMNREQAVAADKAKAEADAKSKVEADAKAKAEADAKAKAAIQKTTITCIKGKSIKKVTAVKPKCPAGFKLKP